jgi:hypothetical protein
MPTSRHDSSASLAGRPEPEVRSIRLSVDVQAERVSSGIEQHADILLGLIPSERRTELNGLGHGSGQIVDRDVEMHHHLLLPVGSGQTGAT